MKDRHFEKKIQRIEKKNPKFVPDYLFKDPTDFLEKHETSKSDSIYKKIELCDDEKMEEMTLRLDKEQRRVLEIGVHFAKNVVKSREIKNGNTGILLSLLV